MSKTPGDGWMPPRMIGGHVAGPAVIARTDRVVVAVRQVIAFSTGLMIEVEAHGRDVPGEGDGLRFGLRFADGTEVAQDDETGLRGGSGPILFRFESSTSSGPESPVDIVMRLWAWPLPPPGRVALTCSWPGAGLDAAEFAIDGPAIRAAAARAEPIWPAD